MTPEQQRKTLNIKYRIVGEIDLSHWYHHNYEQACEWLQQQLRNLRRDHYDTDQRIVLTYTSDQYVSSGPGLILKNLQIALNEVDITSCFIVLLTTNPDIHANVAELQNLNSDSNQIEFVICEGEFQRQQLEKYPHSRKEDYQYGSVNPIKINVHDLTDREKFLLTDSRTFCMYPWIHIHAYPTGEAYPCCYAEMKPGIVGNCRTQTLQEIWYDEPMQRLRDDMLNEREHPACTRCYEQEAAGFFSGRRSANKHHGHHIKKLESNPFEMTYWDIRFSNLCNLKCRSCGHIFSSQWYQDQAKLAGPEWKLNNSVLNYAGRDEQDMWQQLELHLDYVEQIYFAGGEPLLMEEHYNILEELLRRGRTDVKLIYNTNFTHTDLKGRSVFEYWKQFQSVAVGASLDAQGAMAEYIRKGTVWHDVIKNRHDMIRVCPQVDFYISPTLSIMNAWHLPDFHREWVAHGLIRAQDLNVNILQDPAHYRIDIAPQEYKQQLEDKYRRHLSWLSDRDPLQRATQGFESAVTFMNARDNSHLIPQFWARTQQLDAIRNENVLDVIPELAALK
jgi:MoaA/NifB/PqqE/SkfB family radical SAM enzyme